MSGTREGGLKARQTALKHYSEEYLREQAAKGGQAKVAKGFAKIERERLIAISSKGGSSPRKTTKKPKKVQSQRPKILDLRWW